MLHEGPDMPGWPRLQVSLHVHVSLSAHVLYVHAIAHVTTPLRSIKSALRALFVLRARAYSNTKQSPLGVKEMPGLSISIVSLL